MKYSHISKALLCKKVLCHYTQITWENKYITNVSLGTKGYVWNTHTMHVFHTLKYSRLVTGCETSECCWGLAVWDASECHPPNKSPRGAISKAVTPTQPGPLMQTGMECVRQGSGGSGVHGITTLIKKNETTTWPSCHQRALVPKPIAYKWVCVNVRVVKQSQK